LLYRDLLLVPEETDICLKIEKTQRWNSFVYFYVNYVIISNFFAIKLSPLHRSVCLLTFTASRYT